MFTKKAQLIAVLVSLAILAGAVLIVHQSSPSPEPTIENRENLVSPHFGVAGGRLGVDPNVPEGTLMAGGRLGVDPNAPQGSLMAGGIAGVDPNLPQGAIIAGGIADIDPDRPA